MLTALPYFREMTNLLQTSPKSMAENVCDYCNREAVTSCQYCLDQLCIECQREHKCEESR
jgi:hypothetical protein